MSGKALSCRVPPSRGARQNWGGLVEAHPDLSKRQHGVAVAVTHCAGCGPRGRQLRKKLSFVPHLIFEV